jgi:hypothetical protein
MRLCKNVRLAENCPAAVGREATPTGYVETYRRSIEQPEQFWAEAAEAIDWERRWDRVLDPSRPPFYRWFSGAKLNTCWNALDRHVAAGRGDRNALIWDSPVTGQIKRFTYLELRDAVARLAGVLAGLGVVKGDRVLIYMPMVPEAAMAMLACARIGAIRADDDNRPGIGSFEKRDSHLPHRQAAPPEYGPRLPVELQGCLHHRGSTVPDRHKPHG